MHETEGMVNGRWLWNFALSMWGAGVCEGISKKLNRSNVFFLCKNEQSIDDIFWKKHRMRRRFTTVLTPQVW